jgi:hypothetical protein
MSMRLGQALVHLSLRAAPMLDERFEIFYQLGTSHLRVLRVLQTSVTFSIDVKLSYGL